MAQPTPDYVQRRFTSQLSKTDSISSSVNWRHISTFFIRGLIMSMSFYKYYLIKKIRQTFFKTKVLFNIRRVIQKKKNTPIRFLIPKRKTFFPKIKGKHLNWSWLNLFTLKWLIYLVSGSTEKIFSYNVPYLNSYGKFWRWLLLTQGVEQKRLDYFNTEVPHLKNVVYRITLKYNKRNKKKTSNPRKKKIKKVTKFRESLYFFLKKRNFYRNRKKLLKRESFSQIKLVKISDKLVIKYLLRFK